MDSTDWVVLGGFVLASLALLVLRYPPSTRNQRVERRKSLRASKKRARQERQKRRW